MHRRCRRACRPAASSSPSTEPRRSATASAARDRTSRAAGITARTSSPPPGTPLLAVADGTLHTIGFTKIGGYRLWLRDTQGNEFYYAHLSAYSPLAVEGRSVQAGDVVGFVGDTGDAEGGSPHLHFEIHPAAMAGLGYDGVVAPYSILLAWRRADDISFSAGRIFVPTGPGSVTLPPPGAVLLEADDIASTSGLVPGALEKALTR